MAKKSGPSRKDDTKTVILSSSDKKRKPEKSASEEETHILRRPADLDSEQAETVHVKREAREGVHPAESKGSGLRSDTKPAAKSEAGTVFNPGRAKADAADRSDSRDDEPTTQIGNAVTGWIVIVSGPGLGSFKPVFGGRNRLGRSSAADISLDFGDPGISREHAIIHYDPKDRSFHLIPELDVQHYPYLNGKKVMKPAALKANAEIVIADTTMRFVPFCGPSFCWDDELEK